MNFNNNYTTIVDSFNSRTPDVELEILACLATLPPWDVVGTSEHDL